MVENRRGFRIACHAILLAGVAIVAFPVWLTFVGATLTAEEILAAPMPVVPGDRLVENMTTVLSSGTERASSAPVSTMLFNSLVMALVIAIGKIVISMLSAFAIVYFRFPFRQLAFWAIFITLMLPVEVRIVPTFKVVADLHLLDSYAGLSIPLIASATATFLFRQFFLTVPDELAEAARVDGAGPMKFFRDILLPLSRTNIAALFVILFIYGWNQYLWPLMITTKPEYYTIVMAIKRMADVADAIPRWNVVMATVVLAMLPPVLVVVLMQRLFVKGLIESEK